MFFYFKIDTFATPFTVDINMWAYDTVNADRNFSSSDFNQTRARIIDFCVSIFIGLSNCVFSE